RETGRTTSAGEYWLGTAPPNFLRLDRAAAGALDHARVARVRRAAVVDRVCERRESVARASDDAPAGNCDSRRARCATVALAASTAGREFFAGRVGRARRIVAGVVGSAADCFQQPAGDCAFE